MKQLFYIHGGSAYSDQVKYLKRLKTVALEKPTEDPEKSELWPHTLRAELGEEWEVFKPQMPNKYNAKYEEWKIWFERHLEWLEDDIILLGWSQGAYFLAKYLTENKVPVKIKALMLVAAPYEPVEWEGEDGGDFSFDTEKLSSIAKKVGKIHIFHSKDDPVVPYSHAESYKAALPEAKLHAFNSRGHFIVEEFPEIIELIKAA